MKTTSQKNFKPGLSSCVEEKLKEYFDALGGSISVKNLYNIIIEEVERPLLILALRQTEGTQIKASEMLGLNRNTLRKKLTQYKINPNSYKHEPI
ncbi:MAG: Fis family transcriptional regulator [Alphaproteobacteria bacterium]|nr:Fis family transcriptional regulator [Alphaproteobacteria bacterium]